LLLGQCRYENDMKWTPQKISPHTVFFVRIPWELDEGWIERNVNCFFLIPVGTPPNPRFVVIHSLFSWPRSGDCEGCRIWSRDCCIGSLDLQASAISAEPVVAQSIIFRVSSRYENDMEWTKLKISSHTVLYVKIPWELDEWNVNDFSGCHPGTKMIWNERHLRSYLIMYWMSG
jgi:hypothetical protein